MHGEMSGAFRQMRVLVVQDLQHRRSLGYDRGEAALYLALSDRFAIRNYVAMGATTVGKIWHEPDGVFYACSNTRSADVRDGTSNTIYVVETRERNASVWIDGGTAAITSHAYDDSDPIEYAGPELGLNRKPYFTAFGNQGIDCDYGPSSEHPQGICTCSATVP